MNCSNFSDYVPYIATIKTYYPPPNPTDILVRQLKEQKEEIRLLKQQIEQKEYTIKMYQERERWAWY